MLEATNLPEPRRVNGDEADADGRRQLGAIRVRRREGGERHKTQYFEMFGNRGIYHDGWFARHLTTRAVEAKSLRNRWLTMSGTSTTSKNDFSLADDLAAKIPQS